MKPLTLEWIEKAEGDLDTALRELRARRRPNFNAACFHAQQIAEKYLKAWLQENGEEIPHTHNLVDLNASSIQKDPTFSLIDADLKGLDGYAVRIRYPGQSATKEEAVIAAKIAKQIRGFIRDKLGLI